MVRPLNTIHMHSILNAIRSTSDRTVRWFRANGWKKNTVIAVVAFVVLFGLAKFLGSAPAADETAALVRQVEVKSIAELSSDQPTLSIVGLVSSKSEATVRAEKSGQVVSVNRALGDSVAAGTIVASIENASENAAVLSAQGAVDAAQAALAKISGGTRDEQKAILQSSVEVSQSSYISAQSTAVNTLLSAYAAVDAAIRGTTDTMFSNADTLNPQFSVRNPDSQLTADINNGRIAIGPILERQAALSKTVSTNADLVAELDKAEADLRAVRSFFDQIIRALNAGVPSESVSASTIATYQASAIAARATINTSLSAVAGAKQGLAAAKQGITVAQKNLEQGVTGGQKEDVAAAQAGLKQAQGALAAARANLEKSYIRAPISGTINSFSLKRGDYVSMQSPVLTVANNGALEIVAYVTENDAKDVAVGSKVSVEDGGTGVVTRVAPALDPVTKKIEVRIGVSAGSSLINGQSVIVEVTRANARIASKIDKVTVPISAIKIGADETVVFTLDEKNALVAHAVTVGELLGDRVVISEGVTADMKIVTDARGLRAGQIVTSE